MDNSEGSEYSEQGPQTLDKWLSDDEWVSEELGSDIGEDEEDEGASDEMGGYGRFQTFVMPKRMREYKWEVGTYFSEKGDFVEAIRSYALKNGRSLKIVKNDKRKVRVKCLGAKRKCHWLAYLVICKQLSLGS